MTNFLFELIQEQETTANKFGLQWETLEQLIKQIRSECSEIEEAYQKNDREHLQEEVGDLLLAASSLSIFCKLDPSETLRKSCDKFQKRYDTIVDLVKKDGLPDLRGQPYNILMHYWDQAKKVK